MTFDLAFSRAFHKPAHRKCQRELLGLEGCEGGTKYLFFPLFVFSFFFSSHKTQKSRAPVKRDLPDTKRLLVTILVVTKSGEEGRGFEGFEGSPFIG